MQGGQRTRRGVNVVPFTILVGVTAMIFATANAALAEKSGHHDPSPSTIALSQVDPHLGEWVSFDTTYPETYKDPRIIVNCYQGSALVWGEVGMVSDSFKLGGDSSPWLQNGGGPASCYADLENLSWHGHNMQTWEWMAGTEFDVAG